MSNADYIRRYGNPGTPEKPTLAWRAAHLIPFTLPWDMVLYTENGAPVHTIQVHCDAAGKFLAAFNAVWNAAQNNAHLHPGTTTRKNLHSFGGDIFSGAYNLRYTRGYEVQQILSPHAFGIAIDINALQNPMGKPLRTTFSNWYVAAWKSAGFLWGGEYDNRPDAMHFEVK